MASKQASICLDSSSYTSKIARSAPLTVLIPEKPSQSEAMSNQTGSGKTSQKEKITFLHYGILRKRTRLQAKK